MVFVCVCVTFSLLLRNDGWRVGEGLADLAVCSGVGCWDAHTSSADQITVMTRVHTHTHTLGYIQTMWYMQGHSRQSIRKQTIESTCCTHTHTLNTTERIYWCSESETLNVTWSKFKIKQRDVIFLLSSYKYIHTALCHYLRGHLSPT